MQLIDSHSHFDDPRFDTDRREVYLRARRQGVCAQVVPAVTRARWPGLTLICNSYPGLFPAYGLHPMFTVQHDPTDIAALDRQLQESPAVAVGECGLDFQIDDHDRAAQIELFEAQLELAMKHKLPLIIHARKAVEEVIRLLRGNPGLRGVLHSYSGSEQQASQLFAMGFLVSFGGPLTYPRATRLRRLAGTLPLASMMLESDAPDQPDADIRGQRNEPARVARVVQALAELRSESCDEIAARTTANAIELFALSPSSSWSDGCRRSFQELT
ncbi:MAG: TatD family hydrolase [Gammaproteobacteria bacterium]|nr:TatD family hydrolase [Gammaproteobacteria bacterium]